MASEYEVVSVGDIPPPKGRRRGPQKSSERQRIEALSPGEAIKVSLVGLDDREICKVRQRWNSLFIYALGSGNYTSRLSGDALYIWRKDAGK